MVGGAARRFDRIRDREVDLTENAENGARGRKIRPELLGDIAYKILNDAINSLWGAGNVVLAEPLRNHEPD